MPPRNWVPVDRVKQLLAQGLTARQISDRLGVNKSSVSQIANGKYTVPARKDA